MEPEAGSFTQLQLSRRSRSKSSIWRAQDVEAASVGPASRRSTVRNSVVSVADMWAQTRPRDSADTSRTSIDRNPSLTSISTKGQEMRRWDGVKRATAPWDEIRRDPELWFPDGDCFIHFYGRGSSRRGPSLRLHRDDLETAGCMRMLSKFADNALIEEDEEEEFSPVDEDQGPDGGFRSNPNTRGKDELFIPAPPLLNRDEALKFHITTRNFFAIIYEKPMVGAHLGESLVLVHERFNMYRPDKERNRDDMLQYCDDQGYTDFRDCPDHAMAMMYYSEKLRETDLWTEAFVHCVGMYDILNTAVEFPTVSRTIGALITRAHLEMTLRLEHAYADLGGFMEDSITSAYPKLPEAALKHLETFRAFLQSFYVQQHGYWPPPSLEPGADYSVVTKSLLRSMYTDLRNLYQFLRDPRSESKPTQAQIETYQAVYGGLCTPQLIGGFDRRFKHTPLPNSLPLLPSGVSGDKSPVGGANGLAGLDIASTAKPSSGSAFSRFLRPSKRKSQKALNTLNKLVAATNSNDPDVMESLLVQEYTRFEREMIVRGEEKYDPTEARKVRWLLIYALLQTVIGVIAIPQEVSNVEKIEYPLCVQTGGTPPWRKRVKVKAFMNGAATPILEALSTASSPAASPYMTPRSSGARSGAITPISAAESIPPVPQLVLAELEKLNNRSRVSFDSSRDDSRSPRPPGSSADSIRSSGTARPGKSALKSSSASIRSTASTRSSFSFMMNRSFAGGMSSPYADVPPATQTPRERSRKASPKPKEKSREKSKEKNKEKTKEKPQEQVEERPPMQKQKTAPPAVHTAPEATSKKLVKGQRTSMFSWTKSRGGSRQPSPQRPEVPEYRSDTPSRQSETAVHPQEAPVQRSETPSQRGETPVHRQAAPVQRSETPVDRRYAASPAPTSPAQSAFSDTMNGSRFESMAQEDAETPATSVFPQSATSTRSAQPVRAQQKVEEHAEDNTPVLKPIPRLAPLSTIGASEPERGRSTHSPYSPTVASPLSKKVRNFSRGRSMERPSPASPVNGDAPPPVPAGTKPMSRPASPAPAEIRSYTDAGMPPQLPTQTKPPSRSASRVRSPVEREEFATPPPMPNHSTKPRSRAQSMSNSPERELEEELPPPLPVHSKPGSRSASPAPGFERDQYNNSALPPPMPLSTKPASRSQSVSRGNGKSTMIIHDETPPPMPNHSKPLSRSASISQTQAEPQSYFDQAAPPPVPTRSKPNTRPASPIRQQAPLRTHQPDQVLSPTYSAYESATEEPFSPDSVSQTPRPSSRSAALRPASADRQQQQQQQQRYQQQYQQPRAHSPQIQRRPSTSLAPKNPAIQQIRPASNISEETYQSDSVSSGHSALDQHTPETSAEGLQPQQYQQPYSRPNISATASRDRTYQRAPTSSEQAHFVSDPRAVIVEEDSDESYIPHAVSTPAPPKPQPQPQPQSSNPNWPLAAPAPKPRPTPQPSYQQTLAEAEERRARSAGKGSAPRGASRESKFRRAAWADLSAGRNEANGMPVPPVPSQIRGYAAPIARDANGGGAGRYYGMGREEDEESELTESGDEGVGGGFGSYGVRRGIMG